MPLCYIKVSLSVGSFIKFVWRFGIMERKLGNIILLGTSHIAQESVRQIEKTVDKYSPEIIAVELDRMRFSGLMNPQAGKSYISLSAIRKIGIQGFLFALLGGFVQQHLAKKVGMVPGADMKAAVQIAQEIDLPIALIDQDIRITLSNLSKVITWTERWRFIVDIFNAIFFSKREMKRLGLHEFDLQKIPGDELVERLTNELAKRYPNIYRTLVEDRNVFMARTLMRITNSEPDKVILAVVGAGHIKGMAHLIKKLQAEHDAELAKKDAIEAK